MVTKRDLEDDQGYTVEEMETVKQVKTTEEASPSKLPADAMEDMGEFEDAWEDEIEDEDEDEIIVAADSEDDDHDADRAMQLVEQDAEEDVEEKVDTKVYLPGQQMEEEEVLVVDNSAYECLHTLNVEWPCLSFDILKDNLGQNRTSFPATTYLVSGSQAEKAKDNKIYVMKMSRLHKTKHDDDDEMQEDSDDENDLDEDPILEYKTVPHFGSINRIRVMPHLDNHVVATWAETGKVHIWDLTAHVQSLDTPGMVLPKETKPYYTNHKHCRYEGYALDWSPVEVGKLLSGDCGSKIYLTQANGTVFNTEDQAFVGHTDSVEDIQWSPSERSVFASCSVDKTIKIWDTRTRKKPQLSIVAHDTDVNVISWNRSVDHLLASGADNGVFSVWDLRTWVSAASTKTTPAPAATFKWHQDAVTSLEWHPFESSMICVSGADNQVTLWDLALEADKEEETVSAGLKEESVQIPPQLLFIHQGQTNVKEIHFHKQVPGLLLSTAYEGFHVFKTINS